MGRMMRRLLRAAKPSAPRPRGTARSNRDFSPPSRSSQSSRSASERERSVSFVSPCQLQVVAVVTRNGVAHQDVIASGVRSLTQARAMAQSYLDKFFQGRLPANTTIKILDSSGHWSDPSSSEVFQPKPARTEKRSFGVRVRLREGRTQLLEERFASGDQAESFVSTNFARLFIDQFSRPFIVEIICDADSDGGQPSVYSRLTF